MVSKTAVLLYYNFLIFVASDAQGSPLSQIIKEVINHENPLLALNENSRDLPLKILNGLRYPEELGQEFSKGGYFHKSFDGGLDREKDNVHANALVIENGHENRQAENEMLKNIQNEIKNGRGERFPLNLLSLLNNFGDKFDEDFLPTILEGSPEELGQQISKDEQFHKSHYDGEENGNNNAHAKALVIENGHENRKAENEILEDIKNEVKNARGGFPLNPLSLLSNFGDNFGEDFLPAILEELPEELRQRISKGEHSHKSLDGLGKESGSNGVQAKAVVIENGHEDREAENKILKNILSDIEDKEESSEVPIIIASGNF